MDNPATVTEWVNVLGTVGASGLCAALFARFVFRKITEEGAALQRAAGETDIIQQLRAEVQRLADLNESLSRKLGELQGEIVELRGENGELKTEVQALRQSMQRGAR